MTDKLLCARIPPGFGKIICENPHVLQRFGKPYYLGQMWREHFEKIKHVWGEVVFDGPSERRRKESEDFIRSVIQRLKITHCIATQKLLWYSDLIEQICQEEGIRLTWCEPFMDDRMIFDQTGLQYTRDNEFHFEDVVSSGSAILLPKTTRQPQVETGEAAATGADPDKTIVVFGQVSHDMALREYPGPSYQEWLRMLFSANGQFGFDPDTTFLFKHHPLMKTPLVEEYRHVKVIDESNDVLFRDFKYFAAFSSTTILEGLIRGCKFITGGYHFASSCDAVVEATSPTTALVRMERHVPDYVKWQKRLNFVCNHYTLPVGGKDFVDRITLPSEEFFQNR